jgi:hypothetical protein
VKQKIHQKILSPKPLSDNSLPSYFLNFLRPNAARQTKPEPSSRSVAGSGAVETVLLLVFETVSEEVTEFEEKLDLLNLDAELSEGQPEIPKNITTTHKNINNFFIVSPLSLFVFLNYILKEKFLNARIGLYILYVKNQITQYMVIISHVINGTPLDINGDINENKKGKPSQTDLPFYKLAASPYAVIYLGVCQNF